MVDLHLPEHNPQRSVCLPGNKCTNNIIKNTAPNLGCTYVLALPNLVLSVVNIFSNQSSSSFTFNITNFLNPPTTQPVGDFLLQTFNTTAANAALID